MKKLLFTIIFVCLVVYFGPKLVHKCPACEEWFAGTGYEPNAIADLVADEEQTICKTCAEKQHVLETTFGKSLDDYKKKLFD